MGKDNFGMLFGVFDGHGHHGHDVSNAVKELLPKFIYDAFKKYQGRGDFNARKILQTSFKLMQFYLYKLIC